MNAQAKLLEVAGKHQSNPAVQALLLSINESQQQATSCLSILQRSAETYQHVVALEDGYRVPLDSSEMVTYAAKAHAAMTSMSVSFMNLASVLSALGEQIDY